MTWSRSHLFLLPAIFLLTGCELRQAMYDWGHIKPLEGSTFFADGRSSRPLEDGTIARGHLNADDAFYQGKEGGREVTDFPLAVDAVLVKRGRERFDIYCSVCHGHAGYGNGMVAQRGFNRGVVTSMHDEKVRTATNGHLFDVITNGWGVMPSYREQVPPKDRWAIVSYVRALQLSQNARPDDVPADHKAELE